jgi:hypothetical protein
VGFIPIFSNVSYGLPLVILVGVAFVWWWTTRAALPPYFVADPPYHSWRVNPVAAAYSSLREERYLLAAFLLRERVATLAQDRFGISPEDLRAWASDRNAPPLPPPLTLRRVLRDLVVAYRSAYLAEGMRSWQTFAGLTVPIRRRRAARDFERAAREVEQVVAAWEAVS